MQTDCSVVRCWVRVDAEDNSDADGDSDSKDNTDGDDSIDAADSTPGNMFVVFTVRITPALNP